MLRVVSSRAATRAVASVAPVRAAFIAAVRPASLSAALSAPSRAALALQARWASSSSTPAGAAQVDEATHSDFKPVYKQSISSSAEDAKRLIEQDIKTHDVFVYMKGTPSQPKCGFSANVCRILGAYPNVKFGSRDVLEDEHVRQGIKAFSDWPTLPQLFVKGEFVGGSDIVGNMYKSGELDKVLGQTRPQA